MSETKHTPNWQWMDTCDGHLLCDGDTPIMMADPCFDTPEMESLVAASPDMLSALEEVQTAMGQLNMGSYGFVALSAGECQRLKPIIDAAIAKAKGD